MKHPAAPELMVSSVGFKLTPSLKRKISLSLARLGARCRSLFRIRAKIRYYDNGPRRDTFQVRLRFELKGPDVVTAKEGHDPYQLIQEVADTALSRIRETKNKRVRSRRRLIQLPLGA